MSVLRKFWSGDDRSIMFADSLVRFKSGGSVFLEGDSSSLSMAANLACGHKKPKGGS